MPAGCPTPAATRSMTAADMTRRPFKISLISDWL